jgi:hypothetical protein
LSELDRLPRIGTYDVKPPDTALRRNAFQIFNWSWASERLFRKWGKEVPSPKSVPTAWIYVDLPSGSVKHRLPPFNEARQPGFTVNGLFTHRGLRHKVLFLGCQGGSDDLRVIVTKHEISLYHRLRKESLAQIWRQLSKILADRQ